MVSFRGQKIPSVIYFAIFALIGSLATLYVSSKIQDAFAVQTDAYNAEYDALDLAADNLKK